MHGNDHSFFVDIAWGMKRIVETIFFLFDCQLINQILSGLFFFENLRFFVYLTLSCNGQIYDFIDRVGEDF